MTMTLTNAAWVPAMAAVKTKVSWALQDGINDATTDSQMSGGQVNPVSAQRLFDVILLQIREQI